MADLDPNPVTTFPGLNNQVFTDGYHANDGKIDAVIANGVGDWEPVRPIKGIDITTGGKLKFRLVGGSIQDRVVPDNEKIRGYMIDKIFEQTGTGDASGIYPLV